MQYVTENTPDMKHIFIVKKAQQLRTIFDEPCDFIVLLLFDSSTNVPVLLQVQ